MATYYGVKGSSNWASGNWSTTSAKDVTRTGSGVTPTSSDDCILDDWSSDGGGVTWSIASNNCACRTLTCTGYTGTLAWTSSSQQLTVSGNTLVLPTGMTVTGAGQLNLNATLTTFTAQIDLPVVVVCNGAATIPLTSNLSISGTLKVNASVAFTGAYNVTVANLLVAIGSLTWPSGQTLEVTTTLAATDRAGNSANTFKSGTTSSTAYLLCSAPSSAVKIMSAIFTDIDASGGTAIDNWYGGTLTRTSGITNRTSADIGGGSGAGAWAHRMIGGGF